MCVIIFIIFISLFQNQVQAMEGKNGNSQKKRLPKILYCSANTSDARRHELHKASKYGNWKKIIQLYSIGTNLDAINEYQQTALHIAAAFNQIEVAVALLQRKCSPNSRCKLGYTPLHVAAANGHTGMVELLLAFGARPGEISNLDESPVTLAAHNGHTQTEHILTKALHRILKSKDISTTEQHMERPQSEPPHATTSNHIATSSHSAPAVVIMDSILTTTT